MATQQILCTTCWQEVEIDSEATLPCCPHCGGTSEPIVLGDEVTLTLPWHMVRILTIYAEQWAQANRGECPEMPKMIYHIADKIQVQAMDHSGLTLASQVAELRGQGNDVHMYDALGEREI